MCHQTLVFCVYFFTALFAFPRVSKLNTTRVILVTMTHVGFSSNPFHSESPNQLARIQPFLFVLETVVTQHYSLNSANFSETLPMSNGPVWSVSPCRESERGPCRAEPGRAKACLAELNREPRPACSHGAKGVGGRSGAGRMWPIRGDVLPGCGHRSCPSYWSVCQDSLPVCPCFVAAVYTLVVCTWEPSLR